MFKQNLKKTIFILTLSTYLFTGAGFVFAQTIKTTIKTEDKSLTQTLPGLKQLEAFRVKKQNECQVNYVKYKKLVADKDLNTIIDTTKRDLAYEATQNALPEDLRQPTNYGYTAGLDDSKNFIKYHTNGM
ncbi:MAG: hypothetical protein KBB86_03065, partial [Candidatus Pacebacteria bacterium]|nr:hypothetical protein [Candidatus Paceibacterota bacterium]